MLIELQYVATFRAKYSTVQYVYASSKVQYCTVRLCIKHRVIRYSTYFVLSCLVTFAGCYLQLDEIQEIMYGEQ